MFLFILDSIGTSELLLIGLIALIFLGPRKLPQIARTIGKTMADFRKTTSEFKSTWEKEVDFAVEEENIKKQSEELPAQQVERLSETRTEELPAHLVERIGEARTEELTAPAIKEIDRSAFKDLTLPGETPAPETAGEPETAETQETPKTPGKQDWL